LKEKKERETKKKERDDKKAADSKKEENKDGEAHEEKEEKKEEKKSNLPDCRNIVPRSAKRLFDPTKVNSKGTDDDDEFVLYRIIVMKKGADSYKNLCRDRRFTVRPFKYDPTEDQSQKR